MKTLDCYTQVRQTALFEKLGVFFAFTPKQFERGKVEGIHYSALPGGMIVPQGNEDLVAEGLERINAEGVRQDIAENGKPAIIKRELYNYECFYTGDYSDCVDALEDYGITAEDVKDVFDHCLSVERQES